MPPQDIAGHAPWRQRLWLPLTALGLGLALWLSPWHAWTSRPLGDFIQRATAPGAVPTGVLVVDIDDASLAELRLEVGPWPFKRDVYAVLIESLQTLGAKAIVLDVLLADTRGGDAALARVLARPGAPVVMAAAGLPPAQVSPVRGPDGNSVVRWAAMVSPAESVWPAAAQPPRLGVVTSTLDSDGVMRSLTLWHEAEGARWPAMPLAVWHAAGPSTQTPRWPTDAAGRVQLLLPRAGVHPQTLPFARLWRAALSGQAPPELAAAVKDQVVFIGSSSMLADRTMTIHGQAPGAELLALSYAALRDGLLMRPAAAWLQMLLLLAACVPAALLCWGGERWFKSALPLAAAATAALLAAGAALQGGLRIDVELAAPLLTVAAGLGLSVMARQRWLAQVHQRLSYESAVAAAASEAKTAFLANVSHEIRTPLNAVLGVAELLSDTTLTDEQRRHVTVFQQAGQTLNELIDDLLDLTKIEAGRFELHAEVFALRPLLERVIMLLQSRATQKGLELVLELKQGLPTTVHADRKRLQQALTNLLGNAIKFTSTGRVSLTVTPAPGETDKVQFDVADTGIGIAASKLDTIFEPFTQADGSVTRHFGGTGLGLAITRTVATLMGGHVSVRSDPGRGSVFSMVLLLPTFDADGTRALGAAPGTVLPSSTVSLAVAAASTAVPSASPEPVRVAAPAAPPHPSRLLLAEDNEVNVYLFNAMLATAGVQIDVASNGPTALQMAREGHYDLIFMDVQMPGMDGLSVTRELRRFELEHGRPRTPVVALTAHAFASDLRRSLEAGCDLHLPKPFSRAQLLETLSRWVGTGKIPGAADVDAAAPAPVPAPEAVLDHDTALRRLGGNVELHQKLLQHAGVFMARWTQDFDSARQEQRAHQVFALAHDLKSIAASVGADALSESAARIEASLRPAGTQAQPDPQAHAEVCRLIEPVIVALTRRV